MSATVDATFAEAAANISALLERPHIQCPGEAKAMRPTPPQERWARFGSQPSAPCRSETADPR